MWWMTPTYIDENLLIGLRRSSAVTDQTEMCPSDER
jgi:hypothetical protein